MNKDKDTTVEDSTNYEINEGLKERNDQLFEDLDNLMRNACEKIENIREAMCDSSEHHSEVEREERKTTLEGQD